MNERAEQVESKMSDVAQDAAEAMRENPGIALAAIGLVTLGLGVGLWTLLKKLRSEALERKVNHEQNEHSDFRRSGQY